MLESLFNKVVGLTPTQVFFRAKFLRTLILKNIWEWVLLEYWSEIGELAPFLESFLGLPTEIKILSEEDFTL